MNFTLNRETPSGYFINRVAFSGPQQIPWRCHGARTDAYPHGGGRDLEVVQPPQGALPVGEVGGGQLVERLQGDGPGGVGAAAAAVEASVGPGERRGLLAQLPLVHKYGQRLLS